MPFVQVTLTTRDPACSREDGECTVVAGDAFVVAIERDARALLTPFGDAVLTVIWPPSVKAARSLRSKLTESFDELYCRVTAIGWMPSRSSS